MKQYKLYFTLAALVVGTVIISGCATNTTVPTQNANATVVEETGNTNTTAGTNEQANTNDVVVINTVDENTTADQGEVDTSDWLTYENTEIGMKFMYPKNWTFSESLYSWVRFLTEKQEEITISLQRDTTIAKELKIREESDSDGGELTNIDYLSIAGYNAARVEVYPVY